MSEHVLTHLLQQAALISVGVVTLALLRPLLRRLGASALYASWMLLPLLAVIPALPRPGIEPLRVVLQVSRATALPALPAMPAAPGDLRDWVLATWLAGMAAVLALQARRQWVVGRLGSRLPAGSSPALVGLLRPRVALPSDFEQRFTTAQQALILAHEQVHRDRHDNAWNLLACVLAAAHWWNPLVWWAWGRCRADQELACDASVLAAHPGSKADYTRALLAAHDLHHLGAPMASRWGARHPLVERIAMFDRPRLLSRRSTLALGLALLAAAGASYAVLPDASAPPPVVNGFLQLRYALRLSVDGEVVAQPRLVTFPAAPASLTFTEPASERLWTLSVRGLFQDDQHIRVETSLGLSDDSEAIRQWVAQGRRSKPPVTRQLADPALLIADGGQGRVETTTPDGHRLALDVTVSSFRSPSPDYTPPKSGAQPGSR